MWRLRLAVKKKSPTKKSSPAKKAVRQRKKKQFSMKSKSTKSKAKQVSKGTPLTYEGFKEYVKEDITVEDKLGNKTLVETKISHASGPILSNQKVIAQSTLNANVAYDENVIDNWTPNMSLSVANEDTGVALSAAEVQGRRNNDKNYVPVYFVNPMQDLDYLVIQAMLRSTFIGPLFENITKFEVGTGFKPELELINPDKCEEKNAKLIEQNQEVIDNLLGIDAQLNRDDDRDLDATFQEKVAGLITVKNAFNRGALIFGYDTPVKVNGKVYPEIPSSLKFAHARDLGIIEADPQTWRLKSVQWSNAYHMVPAKDMIYLWNPQITAKTRNAWLYGDSMVTPMIDAARVIRKNIGVNFNAMAQATWSGLFLMAIKPSGQNLTEKQAEYKQVVKNLVTGGPNILLEDPDDVKFQNVDYNPKVKEFQDLTEAMLRYCVACTGLPQSMFYDESQSNRATMIGKIQLARDTVINPMREADGRMLCQQWYQRWFRLIYKDDPKMLETFKIKIVFEDLRIEEWFDKVEAVNQIESRKELTDKAYGELVGLQNYENKVDPDAETHPGGQDNSMDLGGGNKLSMKKTKETSPGGGMDKGLKSSVSGLTSKKN